MANNKVHAEYELDSQKKKSDTDDPNEVVVIEDEKAMKEKEKREAKEKKKIEKEKTVPIYKLFKYNTGLDIFFMIIGTLGSIGNGAMFPLLMLFFTNIIEEFSQYETICDPTLLANLTSGATSQDLFGPLLNNMRDQALNLVYVGIGTTFLSYIQVSFWLMPSENGALRIRKKLYRGIMKQDMGWFDSYKSGELTNRLSLDINKIKDGTGDKLGNFIQYIATFIVGVIIGLVKGWQLTLVILSVSPLLILSSYFYTKIAEDMTRNELTSYAKAGAIADEVLAAIRTVFAFNGVYKEHARYNENLDIAKKIGIRKAFMNGALTGLLWLVVFCTYGLGFWYGWKLSLERDSAGIAQYNVGTILLVFFVIIIGVFSLGNAAPYLNTLSVARAAGYEVFQIIDRKPTIDSSSTEGVKSSQLIGNIEFDNIKFSYPTRLESQILKGTSMKINSGSTVAFVGHSGCGKSTCIQLIQRFYDPESGSVKIDEQDIKSYNLQWLRSVLGVVNQEPVLFGTTIKENIKFGKEDITEEQIIEAAKNANAHNFIMELPDNYETLVGDRGGQLSGGQKQRIAIARALVRDPKILLLDEATSALDNESEAIVQAALDKAKIGRTTIIIAHRLSTIRNADVIYAFEKGVVAESGSHDELMKKKSIYYNLVETQQDAGIQSSEKTKKISNENTETRDSKAVTEKKSTENENKEKKDANKSETKTEEEEEKDKGPGFLQVIALNKPEWFYILIGILASIIVGGVQPAFGIIFSKAISVFSLCSVDEQRQRIELYAILFVVFGVSAFFGSIIQSGFFGISGEKLTKRLRSDGFKAMLSQEIGYFDDTDNSVGILSTKLAVEASAVQGATGVQLGFAMMNFANLGVGIIIAFIFSWPLTLLIIAFIPLLIIGGIFQMQALSGFAVANKKILEEAGAISNESIGNVRTVAILNKQEYFAKKYCDLLDIPHKKTLRSAHINGIILGFTNSIMFYAIASAFVLGAYLIQENLFNQNLENILLVFNCVLFGAQSVGQAAAILPDYGKAVLSCKSMIQLFERVPKINNWGTDGGEKIEDSDFDGNIKLNNVEFTYPSRQNQQILKKINLDIKRGQRIALVGSSGCGKSTITQLLERFYDPDEGSVSFSGKESSKLDLHWLRSQIGIVSQEPILFDYSIKENIAYGDNSREVSESEIIEAAKKANIHDFITKLPKMYETNCGAKGTQLSGGQKQRIAIARALVRDPKILLLDEATSALDTESEKIVQDALEKAQQGRTCIIIAHRLSTIKTCDTIYVLQNGVVKEAGTHDELIRLNGFYAKLNSTMKN